MVFKDYDTTFAPVLPRLRMMEEIVAEIDLSSPSSISDVTRSMLAEIELHINNADTFYRRNKYDSALNEFKRARASIYKILYPDFDVSSYIGRGDVSMPISPVIENSLLENSVQIADILRPQSVEMRSVLGNSLDVLPETLRAFTSTGFHESISIEETVQLASAQGVALLNDNRAEAAIHIMQNALAKTTAPGTEVDPALKAALELNISCAYIQIANTRGASMLAKAALESFRTSNDLVGQAQALHVSGVCEQIAGNMEKAKELLKLASDTLKNAPSDSINTPVIRSSSEFRELRIIGRNEISIRSPALKVKDLVTRDMKVLQPIANMNTQTVTFRIPGRLDGWGSLMITDKLLVRQQSKAWNIGVPVGQQMVFFTAGSGKLPSKTQLVEEVYKRRQTPQRFKDIDWKIVDTSTTTFYITHLYCYVLPVKIGDCFYQLGQYAKAEEYFKQASQYSYLNKEIEATLLFNRLLNNAFQWGESLYKKEDLPGAKTQYLKIITDTGAVPTSFPYNTSSLTVPANAAKSLIESINIEPLPDINWEISNNVLMARSRLLQIAQGLDFYGLMLSPIHTFEYLQDVARSFAQEAIQAEHEFVEFKSREEMEEATRRDLEAASAMAHAEESARLQQFEAAKADELAAQHAHELATKRHEDAKEEKKKYESTSSAAIWTQAAAQAAGGGEDAWYGEISALADQILRGEEVEASGPILAAAFSLAAGRKTQKYELKKMQDNIEELAKAIEVAKEQWNAATNRREAADAAYKAAIKQREMTDEALVAFDDEFFTAESWSKMADIMRNISKSYIYRAIRIAKLMERSFNFENDTELQIVKNEYGHGVANAANVGSNRLLGGDRLLQDIDSFTHYAITHKIKKNSLIKDVIPVSEIFPAQFENFRTSGLLSIETDLNEFDRLHPGFYSQHIQAVEVEIIGLLPKQGLNGTLTAGGVTSFRKRDGTVGKRVHVIDTMALSNFVLRDDGFLFGTEKGVRGLFQGIGLGSTWQLHLPKRSNDFDFRRIFDVHLIFYYTANYDLGLRANVLQAPPPPGGLDLIRNYGLRYDFPDAWYALYRNGIVEFTLDRFRLPVNQKAFKVLAVMFRIVTKNGISNEDIELRITDTIGHIGTIKTDVDGMISTERPELAALIGTNPVGTWKIEMIGGPSISEEGKLKFERIYNIQMGLEYSFEYVDEVI